MQALLRLQLWSRWRPPLRQVLLCAHQCLLMHGHGGYDRGPMEQRLRDLLGFQIGDGTAQIMKTIIARARDAAHAAQLYAAGATHAVPETLEASLQLAEAVLAEMGVPMGFVIASIHEKRDELREEIMRDGGLTEKPQLKSSGLRERT